MENKNKITKEHYIHMFMLFDMQLRALKNSQDKDMALLLDREEKQLYNLVIKKADELRAAVERRFPTEAVRFIDEEGSYLFLDIISLLRNIDNRKHIQMLYSMMKVYVEGGAKIIDENEVGEVTKDAMVIKAFTQEAYLSDPGDEVDSIKVRQG
jgi:hypothetical protein